MGLENIDNVEDFEDYIVNSLLDTFYEGTENFKKKMYEFMSMYANDYTKEYAERLVCLQLNDDEIEKIIDNVTNTTLYWVDYK